MIPAGEGIESPGWTFKQDSCDPVMSDSHTNTHTYTHVLMLANMLSQSHLVSHTTNTHSQIQNQRRSLRHHTAHLQNSPHPPAVICAAEPEDTEAKNTSERKSQIFYQYINTFTSINKDVYQACFLGICIDH